MVKRIDDEVIQSMRMRHSRNVISLPSQQDIERALLQIGGTFGQDPEATIQTLQDIKVRTAKGFETRAEGLLGKAPERLAVTPRPKKQPDTLLELREDVDVENLPAGTRYIWLPDGKEYIKE